MHRLIIPLLLFLLLITPLSVAEEHPAWNGSPFVVYGDGQPSFDGVYLSGEEFAQYSPRDELGRVGPALAYLGPKRFQAERESMQLIMPTGFKNAKYDFIAGGSLYHRCHLIAHRMTSSGEYAENLFTGTAFLNTGAMAKTESQVAEYIIRTGNHVIYKVSPDFIGEELVCRGVIIEAASIEDTEIRICIYCFNVQPGVIIDYKTGYSALAQYATEIPESEIVRADVEEDPSPEFAEDLYVLNTSRKRFHKPDCKSVSTIKPENRQDVTDTRDHLIEMGYKPCGDCKP